MNKPIIELLYGDTVLNAPKHKLNSEARIIANYEKSLLDYFASYDKPTVSTIKHDSELKLIREQYCKILGSIPNSRSVITDIAYRFSGIVVYTGITTEDNRRLWLIIPKTYLNAGKLNVVIPEEYLSLTARFIGVKGANARNLAAAINSIKGDKYSPVLTINYNQRKNKDIECNQC